MKKRKIFVVEDESIVARDIRNMLITLGYEVSGVVSTGEKAIQIVKETQPDLVLMDLMLPGEIDGVKAADKIYKHFNIPVVYLTAYTDENTLHQAKKAEPFGYLLKPFDEKDLQTTIEISLYKYQMEMKLKDRERWLSTILRSIGDAVIATDKGRMITFLNPLAEKFTGWDEKKALRKPISDVFSLLSEETGRKLKVLIPRKLEKSGMGLSKENILLSKEGTKIPIEHSITPIRNEIKEISGSVLVFRDITDRRKAQEEIRKGYDKLQKTMEGIIQAMAFTIEKRDPYTAGHQRRVTVLACAIAEEMNLSKEKIEGIRMAGNIHDIGKIHVPAEILSKPGKISEAEFSMIKTHPTVGYEILKTVEFPWPIARIVLQHHERMDGSGYPSGLHGKEILLEARILSVADVVEAMSSHRPYRPAHSIDKALDEIRQQKGILYDPQVVATCIKIFKRNKFKFE